MFNAIKNESIIQVLEKLNQIIVFIDFSITNDLSMDEIDRILSDQKSKIVKADAIWIVDVHIKPKLREILSRYINFPVDYINFVSKIMLDSMSQTNNGNQFTKLKLPCIDDFIEEYRNEVLLIDNFLKKVKYSISFMGYDLSIANIEKI